MAAESLVAGDQTLWSDATEFISEVCRELDPGQLVHGENFSLFESMSALEIMDPKMDGGMDIGGPKSIDEAISMGMAPSNLSVSQMIDVMDHIFSCEASWHTGHSLAQTVYSNIYMLKVDCAVSMPLLYSFCKLTRVTCRIARATVIQAHTHEEEDIFAMAFGLPLEMNDSDCLAVLSSAEDCYSKKIRQAKSAQDNEQSEERCVLSRLHFRKALYQALMHLDKPQGRGLETARKHLSTALQELSNIRSSSKFLASQRNEKSSATTASGRSAAGFDENLNRTLLPPTPPRCMKLLEWSQTLDYFERLLRDLERVCSVPLSNDLEGLLQLILNFQKGNPDLVARAHMQVLVLHDSKLFGTWPMSDVVYKSIYRNESVRRDTHLERFLQQAGWLVIHLLRMSCAHPAWQCRKLGKTLEDWTNLFQQVELFEDSSKETPALSWLAYQSSWIAWRYLWMGFELDLYLPEEYCMIYWYLDHVLLTFLHYESEREGNMQADSTTLKKKSKKKRSVGAKDSGKPVKDVQPSPKVALMLCLSDICKACIWMLVALNETGKVTRVKKDYTTERERYSQRFELLHKLLVPYPLPYQSFKDATTVKNHSTVQALYYRAENYFTTAESNLQGLLPAVGGDAGLATEIGQLQQVVRRNRIALRIIDSAGPGDAHKVSFQFSHHPCFGVVVLKGANKK